MRKVTQKTVSKLIVIALPLLSDGEIELVQGIRKSLLPFGDNYEVLVLSGGYEASLRKLADLGELAGAIGEFMSPIWLESLIGKGLPVVQLGQNAGYKIPRVSSNLTAMGEDATRALFENGVQSLAYLGASGPSASALLGEAFAASGLARGHTVALCNEFSGPMLKAFLHSLDCPIGLLCATDRLAHLATLAAKETGMRIPQDLAVIGVGNSRMESLHAGVALSSFDLSLGEIGIKAGTLMADLIRGKSTGISSVLVEAKLHERDSSLRSSSGVTRALAYLRSNPGTNMSAGEMARHAGMSRRSFEMALQAECGKSPGVFLQEMRKNRAKSLLRESDLAIAEIGRECGYQEAAVFSVAFKRWTGKSPRDFRAG
jgi:DNA-binding LacI/PurR family transcriptional regulator